MAMTTNQISDAALRLLLAPGIGPLTHRALLDYFGSEEEVITASVSRLAEVHRIGADTARAIRRSLDESDVDVERELLAQHGVNIIPQNDKAYPNLLRLIPDPPSALWVRGTLPEADGLAVAIVGSRRCTAYGREQAGRFASLLAQSGLTIVSGGAKGIDGEAHRGALRVRGRTVVVLGCGLLRAYPSEHESLFRRVVEKGGAIVSEYPMRIEPKPQHFPRRNRIISGLSLGVLVIEAARRSGALITARLAAEDHNREVMALPGRVDSPASSGCLELLRGGGAALVCDHTDVLMQLDGAGSLLRRAAEPFDDEDGRTHATHKLFDANMTDEQKQIIKALSDAEDEPMLLDELAARTQLPMSRLMADVSLLQIRGRIRRDHRGVALVNRRQ